MKLIDYQVRLIPLNTDSAHEAITKNEDGSYTIFIDCNMASNKQQKSFIHALEHILQNDFGKDSVDVLEYYAHETIN